MREYKELTVDHPFDNDITQQQKGNFGKGYKRIIEIN